jgi:simple sugar transport system ATP-binding protein
MSNNKGDCLLEGRKIVKRFGSITSLDGVVFQIGRGGQAEVVGLLGDNGAGKSTLIKVLTGVHPPEEGQLLWEGQPIRMDSPRDAMKRGISTVYQDLGLVDTLSIYRNMFLGREEAVWSQIWPFRFLHIGKARSETKKALEKTGITVRSVDEFAAKLSGGERQAIALARAIYFETKLLILDEPFAALGLRETAKVLEMIVRAREEGVSVVLIVHNMNHVYPIADRFTVLSQGKVAGSFDKAEKTFDELSEFIISGSVVAETD